MNAASLVQRFAILSLAALGGACGNSPIAPATSDLTQRIETASFEFHYAAGDTVQPEWQETFHRWAVEALQVSVPSRIRYYKYTSREHMGRHTGNYNTNAFANPERFEVHTIWAFDNHEVVHLYASAFGRPVALWSEGFAVAFQVDPVAGRFEPRWSGTPLDDLARQFQQQGRLVPLADLLITSDFRRFDPNVTYPEAGSFVRFLLERDGLEPMKRLFARGTPGDSAASVLEAFAAVYGHALSTAEAEWHAALGDHE